MPQKAKNESLRCCAYSSRDKRRCRLECEPSKKHVELTKIITRAGWKNASQS